jgi:pimeloyl-ACP methyl ester carboxylesterase
MQQLTGRRYLVGLGTLALIVAAILGLATSRAHAKTPLARAHAAAAKPTIVLVNGAWANNASWSAVVTRLQAEGYTVDAPPNPLMSLMGDAATIRDFLNTITGPIVLVGHSYGGAVITNAALGDKQVKALVYIDAFAPDKGQTVLGLDSSQPGSVLGAPVSQVFNEVPYPGAPKGDALLYVQPSVFLKGFANVGISKTEGAALAATQGPVTFSALTTKSGTPAWKTIPSWYELGTQDEAIPPAVQLAMATTIGAHITKVDSGHLPMISNPGAVTTIITKAAAATK